MLYGKRTRLRALERSDLDDLHRWWNTPDLWIQMGSRRRISGTEELEAWFDGEADKTSAQEGRTLAIEDAEGNLVGTIWYGGYDPGDRQTLVGLYLGEAQNRGQGLGTDALQTLLGYLFEDLGMHKVRLLVLASNSRAIACYERCGFVTEGILRDHRYFAGRHHDFLSMAVLAPEWRAES